MAKEASNSWDYFDKKQPNAHVDIGLGQLRIEPTTEGL
jgi:hypothetical protein